MVKKIVGLGVLLMMIFSLVGCGNKYNAVMYDNAKEWMSEEFLRENLTRGAFYEDVFLDDNSYPKNITHIIKSKEEFDAIFAEFPSEVDFESSIVFIYIFTCNSMGSSYKISKNRLGKNKDLKIYFKRIKPKKLGAYGGGMTSPGQRCFVVTMNKLDVITVEFVDNE
ncbi:MAG: hypothetical protein LBL66_10725 [Clostridiales bacterium]|jgi:hypothetical protein|nr:hypothetical protein [Clostridiales bacterium]